MRNTNFLPFLHLLIVLSISSCIHLLFLDDVEILVLKCQVLHLEYKQYTKNMYAMCSYFSIDKK